jgi:hypothetical protein
LGRLRGKGLRVIKAELSSAKKKKKKKKKTLKHTDPNSIHVGSFWKNKGLEDPPWLSLKVK